MSHPESSEMNPHGETGIGNASGFQNATEQTHATHIVSQNESKIRNALTNNQLKLDFEGLFDLKHKPDSYVFVDTKTTGEQYYDEIVELNALYAGYEGNSIVIDSFNKILHGEIASRPFMLGKHGITEGIRKEHGYPAPTVLNSFVEWLRIKSPNYLVAHSAIFHGKILLTQLDKHEIRYALPEFLCTLKMAERKKLPLIGLSLTNLAEYYGCFQQSGDSLTNAQIIAILFAKMSLSDKEARTKEYGLAYNVPPSQTPVKKTETVLPHALAHEGHGEVSVEGSGQGSIDTVAQTDPSPVTPNATTILLPSSPPDAEKLNLRRGVFLQFRSSPPDQDTDQNIGNYSLDLGGKI